MKKQLYSRKIGIAALVGASIFIFVLLHFCRMSIGKIPELEFSEYVNQSDIVNSLRGLQTEKGGFSAGSEKYQKGTRFR